MHVGLCTIYVCVCVEMCSRKNRAADIPYLEKPQAKAAHREPLAASAATLRDYILRAIHKLMTEHNSRIIIHYIRERLASATSVGSRRRAAEPLESEE